MKPKKIKKTSIYSGCEHEAGKALIYHLAIRRIPHSAFAKHIGVSRQAVRQWVTTRNFSKEKAKEFAKALGVNLSEFYDYDPDFCVFAKFEEI